MDLGKRFDRMQSEVNASPEAVKTGRERRSLFIGALEAETDVLRAFPSGSFARNTQIDPINDVDIVVVFDPESHPEWGADGPSAADSLEYVRSRVRSLLGVSEGTIDQVVRLAKPRNHAVKCWLDDPDDADAFTVDVTPALPGGANSVRIPEKLSSKWIETAPEYLVERVKNRNDEWAYFVPLVRVLKRWVHDSGAGIKGLALEVLALDHLPDGERPASLAAFFTAAAVAVRGPIEDPARLCGEIQPDLDRDVAQKRFEVAADTAWKAVHAQQANDDDLAACLWRRVFGGIFPEPERGCDSAQADKPYSSVAVITPRPVRDAPQG